MPLVIPLKPTVDIDLFKPVASFLRNTFSELGAEAAQEMSRQFDNQRRVACVKALDKTETSLLVLMAYHDQLVKVQGKIPFTEQDCHVKVRWVLNEIVLYQNECASFHTELKNLSSKCKVIKHPK